MILAPSHSEIASSALEYILQDQFYPDLYRDLYHKVPDRILSAARRR